MAKKQVYTITQLKNKIGLLNGPKPFDITSNGHIIATIVSPQNANWRVCEKCGENTQNIIEFQNKNFKWEKLILCDKCSEELL